MCLGQTLQKIRKAVLPAVAAVALSGVSAQAASVLHEGTILNPLVISGVGFSSLHTSTNGAGGGYGRGSLSGDVAYNWNIVDNTDPTVPTTFAEGTTATFDVRDLKIYDRIFGSNRFELTLLQSATSVLTVGEALDPVVSLGGRTVAHSIGGNLDFRLDQFNASTGALIASASDSFFFDNAIMMSVVNGVAEIDAGSVEVFLWGDTGSRNSFTCDTGDCWKIKKKFYSTYGLGIDLAFNGTVSAVPVPAALPLLLSGIGGLVFVARRRKSARAA